MRGLQNSKHNRKRTTQQKHRSTGNAFLKRELGNRPNSRLSIVLHSPKSKINNLYFWATSLLAKILKVQKCPNISKKHPKTVFSGPRSKASYRYLRSTIFHDTKYGCSLEIDKQTNEGLVDHTFSCLACTLVHADLHHRAKLHGGSRHGPIFKRRKTSCRTRKDGKNICKLW